MTNKKPPAWVTPTCHPPIVQIASGKQGELILLDIDGMVWREFFDQVEGVRIFYQDDSYFSSTPPNV